MRAVFIITSLLLSGLAAYFGQPLMRDNSDAVNIITTVITVFAGFLVAIIAILGDPAMIPEGSWRTAEARREKLENMVIRHTWLFYVYLATISALFTGMLIRKEPESVVSAQIKIYIEYAYLFLGVFSFLLTLSLPRALGQLQLARSDAEIESRRAADGIPPHSDL